MVPAKTTDRHSMHNQTNSRNLQCSVTDDRGRRLSYYYYSFAFALLVPFAVSQSRLLCKEGQHKAATGAVHTHVSNEEEGGEEEHENLRRTTSRSGELNMSRCLAVI